MWSNRLAERMSVAAKKGRILEAFCAQGNVCVLDGAIAKPCAGAAGARMNVPQLYTRGKPYFAKLCVLMLSGGRAKGGIS